MSESPAIPSPSPPPAIPPTTVVEPEDNGNGNGKAGAVGVSPRVGAAIAALILLAVYWASAAPGVTGEDAGELTVAAWNWSIAHPPGYPLFTFVGWLWLWPAKWFGLNPAWWLALLGGLLGAAAGWHLALAEAGPRRDAMAISRGAVAALVAGLATIWWAQCTMVEVYPLALLLMAIAWRVFRSAWRAPATDLDLHASRLGWLAMISALGAAAHPAAAVCAFILGIAVVVRAPRILALPATWLRIALGIVPGLLVLGSMLWRGPATPDVAWARPDSLDDLKRLLLFSGYSHEDLPSWPVSAYVSIPFGALYRGLGWLLILPLIGLLRRLWELPTRPLAVVELIVGAVLVVLVLANSQTQPDDPASVSMHHVLMFFGWPLVGFWTAEALHWLAQVQPKPDAPPLNDWRILAAGGAIVAAVLIGLGWDEAAPDDISQQWLSAVEASAPENAVIVPDYDPHAFPLFYARHFNTLRGDIRVVSLSSIGPCALKGLTAADSRPGLTAARLAFLQQTFPGRPLFSTDVYFTAPAGWRARRIGVLTHLAPADADATRPTIAADFRPRLLDHPFVIAATSRPVGPWDWPRGTYARDAWRVRLEESDAASLSAEELDALASACRFVPAIGEAIGATMYRLKRYEDGRGLLGRLSNDYPHRKGVQHWLAMNELGTDVRPLGFERLQQVAMSHPDDIDIWIHLVRVGFMLRSPSAPEWNQHLVKIGGPSQIAPQTQSQSQPQTAPVGGNDNGAGDE